MGESVKENRTVGGYVSRIKINGKPIIPPLMTPERTAEMKQYKEMAIAIEAALSLKRNSVDSGVMICPSRSQSWENQKSIDMTETVPQNVHLSHAFEETLLYDQMQRFSSPDASHFSRKVQASPEVPNNATEGAVSCNKNVKASHFRTIGPTSALMNTSECHRAISQNKLMKQKQCEMHGEQMEDSETTLHLEGGTSGHSFSVPKNGNTSCNIPSQKQDQHCVLEIDSCNITGSTPQILSSPSSSCHVKMNFGTAFPVHRPMLHTTSPIPESSNLTADSINLMDESIVPVKKVHASLNISEIIAEDDIIQDGLGFKVWKSSCNALKKRPRYSSTPADTIEENISNSELVKVENFDESMSSIAVSASTDLNNYMNTSDSSKSSASIQSLSSIAASVFVADVKQTSIDQQVCRSSLEDQNGKQKLQGETKTCGSFSNIISKSEVRNYADNLGIDGIRPLETENEVGHFTPQNAEQLNNTANKHGTVKKFQDNSTDEKMSCNTTSNDSTSSHSSPPRLKRQHSYVLESPSPLLVEHLKTCKYDGDMTASPTKKMLSSSETLQGIQKHRSSSGIDCNASLPNTAVSSPVKLKSPFGSSDCLPSTVPKDDTRMCYFSRMNTTRKSYSCSKENKKGSRCISSESLRRLSVEEKSSYGKTNMQRMPLVLSPRCSSIDNISSAVSKKSCGMLVKHPKTPRNTSRNNPSSLKQNKSPKCNVKNMDSANQDLVKESLMQEPTPLTTPEKHNTSQEELRAIFLQLQIEHKQQMEELIEKQKREQKTMREAFRQQQNQLMDEIRGLCPEVFSTPESQKLLAKSYTSPLTSDSSAGQKIIKNERAQSETPLEREHKDVQENNQKQAILRNDQHFSGVQMESGTLSGLHDLDDISCPRSQNMSKSISGVAETSETCSNINTSQELHSEVQMESDGALSGFNYLDDTSDPSLQNMSKSIDIAETSKCSNINFSQELHHNKLNLSGTTDFSDIAASSLHIMNRNNANQAFLYSDANEQVSRQHLEEKSVLNIQNFSTSTSDISEKVPRENILLENRNSNSKSNSCRAVTTKALENVEFSDSIVTSGASGNKVTQQMLYSLHADNRMISKIQHLDEVSLSSLRTISTSTSDIAEVSKQTCQSKPELSDALDRITIVDTVASVAPDLGGNKVSQQVLYSMPTDGKVVSRLLTVAKSEVILSEGLPYSEPREETVRTTVYTQLNGVDHDGVVDAHFSTVVQGRRQSCSRELFPTCSRYRAMYTKVHERAATRIQAGIRGYLTRRLFQTARVQDLIKTLRDTLLCAVQLSQECWLDIQPEDVALHRRLIQQVTAACYALHDVFFSLPISEKMAIIAGDREKQRSKALRTFLPLPLSAATRRALERKMKQDAKEEKPKSARTRRTWSTGCESSSGSYRIARSCLLRQRLQQDSSPQPSTVTQTRHSINGIGRRPWR